MRFTKMHGLGNDYVYVNCFSQTVNQPEKLAIQVSDRHFGIGSDGLILALPSDTAHLRMRMFNADGSEAQMCGNGIRCLAKFAYEHGVTPGSEPSDNFCNRILRERVPGLDEIVELRVETGRGVLTLGLGIIRQQVEQVAVDMGEPILLPTQIPVKVTGQQAVGIPLTIENQHLLMTCVSMGNPHAVFYCPDVAAIHLEHLGPLLENHPLFPERVNVHFVQRISNTEVIMRTWERGSGITLACGTGAAAVCVAGVLASKTDPAILAHLPGGDLRLQWHQQNHHVYMIGPAAEVFTGHWPGQ
jgi:diaminopimelate epimerase